MPRPPKPPGTMMPSRCGQLFAHGILRQRLRIDPLNIHHGVQRVARMAQSLRHGEIGVVKLDVLAHEADGDVLVCCF